MADLAKIAYDAYAKYLDETANCTVTPWDELEPSEQAAWGAAVEATLRFK